MKEYLVPSEATNPKNFANTAVLPKAITPAILLACKELAANASPDYVPVLPRGQMGQCYLRVCSIN